MNKLATLVKDKQKELRHERQQHVVDLISSNDRTFTMLELTNTSEDDFVEACLENLHQNRFVTRFKAIGRNMCLSAPSLAGILNKTKTIVMLRLSSCELNDEAVTTILGGLIKNSSVISLVLDNNHLQSAAGLALLMQHNTCVEHMDLTNNELGLKGDEEFAVVADAIERSKKIKALHLGGNGMSDTAAKGLCLAVERTIENDAVQLTTLELGDELSVRPETRRFLSQVLEMKKKHLERAEAQLHVSMASSGIGESNSPALPGTPRPLAPIVPQVEMSDAETMTIDSYPPTLAPTVITVRSPPKRIDASNEEGNDEETEEEEQNGDGAGENISSSAADQEALLKMADTIAKLQADLKTAQLDLQAFHESAKEKEEEHEASIGNLRATITNLEEEVDVGKTFKERNDKLLSAQLATDAEVEQLRTTLSELQTRQVEEMTRVSDLNLNLRENLDAASTKIATLCEERDKLLARAEVLEKNVSQAVTRGSQFQRALESLTTSSLDVVSSEVRQTKDGACLTAVVKKKRKKKVPPPAPPVATAAPSNGAVEPTKQSSWYDAGEGEDLEDNAMTKDRWVTDDSVDWCMAGCATRFSFSNRKHHCRRCGRVFCDKCCPKSNMHGGKRMCVLCLR